MAEAPPSRRELPVSALPCAACGGPKLHGLCPRCDLAGLPLEFVQHLPRSLALGVYALGEEIHFELGQVLEGMGVADTPANRAEAAEEIRLACSQVLPGTPVHEV